MRFRLVVDESNWLLFTGGRYSQVAVKSGLTVCTFLYQNVDLLNSVPFLLVDSLVFNMQKPSLVKYNETFKSDLLNNVPFLFR
jgi:hypothetical protein